VADNKQIGGTSVAFTAATDEIAGVDYQFVKIVDGTLDSTYKLVVTSAGEMMVKATSTLPTAEVRATTATRTIVAAATGSTPILAANAARKSSLLYNDSTSVAYIGMGTATVSSTDYSFPLAGGGIYEVEYGYTGVIKAAWVSATGQMRVTEFI